MSRVLIFGGDGLLGSHLYLALKDRCELYVTLHGESLQYSSNLYASANVLLGVAAGDEEKISAVIASTRPDWVVNAIGLSKQLRAQDPFASLEANTLFPHLLARLSASHRFRFIHFSTDGVFSGSSGNYSETDSPDCHDWYGRCKLLGEPPDDCAIVLRSSFVGVELGCKRHLVEWYLAQSRVVAGFRKVRWSGFTALEIARVIARIISDGNLPNGIWHVASQPISKYEFLVGLASRLTSSAQIIQSDDVVCDRSLNGAAFSIATGYVAPDWTAMLDELADDIRKRWRPSEPSIW